MHSAPWKLSPVLLERGELAGESRTSPEFHPSFRTPLVENILTEDGSGQHRSAPGDVTSLELYKLLCVS